jgi:hypothetical protein
MGLSFTIDELTLVLASAVILGSESSGSHDHILLSQIRDSPKLEGQVPVFISSRKRIAQLNLQALGSLLVTSYDSQGYCGGIRPRLQARNWLTSFIRPRYIARHGYHRKYRFQEFLHCSVTRLEGYCLAMARILLTRDHVLVAVETSFSGLENRD